MATHGDEVQIAGTVVSYETPGHFRRVVSEARMSRLSITDECSRKGRPCTERGAGTPLSLGILDYGAGRVTRPGEWLVSPENTSHVQK